MIIMNITVALAKKLALLLRKGFSFITHDE
jgi:hypothetical protein